MVETIQFELTRTQQSRLQQTDFNQLPFGRIFSDHMFIADYKDGKWYDLRIVPYGDIGMSPAISALHYGQAFFEGLKAYKHQDSSVHLFRPEKNAARFNISAQRMCMPELPEDIFVQSIAALVDIDRGWIPNKADHSLYIRPFMFATDPFLGVQPSGIYSYVVLTGPTGPYYPKPLKVKIEDKFTRAAEGGTGYAKTAGNYAASLLPAKIANQEGFDQLIWTDAKTHSYIEEAGTANIMFVIDGALVTPPTGNTILKGITRDTIIQLAKSWNVQVEERPVSVTEVIEGISSGKITEAFAAGTAATVAHIAQIGYDAELYTLPEVSTRKLSTNILNELNAIRYGQKPDPFGWNYKV